MAGSSNITGLESIIFADNASFDGTERGGALDTDGQLWTGSTASPHVQKGSITSPLGTLTVGYSSPNITLDLVGGGSAFDSIAVQTGTSPVVPTAAGLLTLSGAVTAAGTNPVRTDGTGANTIALEVQTSQALTAADATKIGLSNFSSNDFVVDSTGFVTANSTKTVGFSNLGITLSAGTFSVTAANGTALSSTNRGYVTIRSTVTPGTLVTIPVTANQTFIDDSGASTIIGNLFGLPTGVAYAQDIPFAIYAVADSTEATINFGLSRYWSFTNSPVAGRLGKTGSAVADLTGSMFLFGDPTVANYATQSLLRIGWIRMRMSAADDWTVQTLGVQDGLSLQLIRGEWTYPTGAFGATAGSYFLANGGTAPTFNASSTYVYSLIENGYVELLVKLNDGGADGVGAVEARLSTPYSDTSARVNGIAYGTCTPFTAGVMVRGTGSAYYSTLLLTTTGGVTTNVDWVGTKALDFSVQQFVSVNV